MDSQDKLFLQKLQKKVLENLKNDQFGVEDLAREVCISRSQLHRKLKQLKGQSISVFIRQIRLEEAMKLLKNDVATVSEIAYMVGFSSTSYFNKCFQNEYGFPPGEAKAVLQKQKQKDEVLPNFEEEKKEEKSFPGFYFVIGGLALVALLSIAGFWGNMQSVPAPVDKSLAVLPFASLSTFQENQHFADGLVEDLLYRISLIEGVKVISRTSSDQYRERGEKSLSEIAEELGVFYLLEGSVQRTPEQIKINVKLIDAASDVSVWSHRFERKLDDVFKIQSEVALQVAKELNAILNAQQISRIQRHGTENIKAFEWYQLGRFHWNRRTREGFEEAIEYFEKALEEDPDYALAYAGLADTYYLLALRQFIARESGTKQAIEYGKKALALNPDLAEVYTMMASINTYIHFNWSQAEEQYQKAMAMNPNYATAYQYYAEHLMITGRGELARMYIDKALELDPVSFVFRYTSALVFFHTAEQFEKAMDEVRICQDLNPGHSWLREDNYLLNQLLGENEEAVEGYKEMISQSELLSLSSQQIDSIYQASGFPGLDLWRIKHTKDVYSRAVLYGRMGMNEEALDLLEEAVFAGNYGLNFTYDRAFKDIRNHPRFISLLNTIGLPWEPEKPETIPLP